MPDSPNFRERRPFLLLAPIVLLGAIAPSEAQDERQAQLRADIQMRAQAQVALFQAQMQARAPLPLNGALRSMGGQTPFMDLASVKEALAKIQTLQDATPLYFRLFQMRSTRGVRPEQVMLLLEKEAAAEKPESTRWAVLQILRGYGGFTIRGFNCDANDAYLALFSSTTSYPTQLLTHALNNYINSVSGGAYGGINTHSLRRGQVTTGFLSNSGFDSASSPEVLNAAFKTYLSLPPEMNATDLRWGDAANSIEVRDEVLKEIETQLANHTAEDASRLRLLRMAFPFYETPSPDKALQIGSEIEDLSARLKWTDVTLHDRHVGVLTSQKKWEEAARVQAAWVKRVNTGYGKLMELWLQAGNAEEAQKLTVDLEKPETNPRVQFEVITVLNKAWSVPGFAHKDAVRDLSEAFLKSTTAKSPDSEITVRLILARLLYASKEKASAVQVLDGMRFAPVRSLNYMGSQVSILSETRQRMADGTFCDA